MTERPRTLMIGDFARRCRLPISTLRYYHKIGLLTPAAVDPTSGYRRYTIDQLVTAVRIHRLRAIGTTPRDIAIILAGGDRAAEALARERRRLAARLRDARRALAEMDELVAHRDELPARDVERVSLTRRPVAVAPFRARHGDLESAVLRSIAGLRSALRRAGRQRSGPWGAIFPLEATEHVSGLAFVHTGGPVDHPDLATAWLPPTLAARIVHLDGPDTLALSYHAALDTIHQWGRSPTGAIIEEYPGLDGALADRASIRLTVPIGAPGVEPSATGRDFTINSI